MACFLCIINKITCLFGGGSNPEKKYCLKSDKVYDIMWSNKRKLCNMDMKGDADMLWLHKLLAKIGWQTDRYKIEKFKAEHPLHVVVDTHPYDVLDNDNEKRYKISSIDGDGVLFIKGKRQAYIEQGRAEFDIQVDQYRISYMSSRRHCNYIFETFYRFRVTLDVTDGLYRFRFDDGKNELQIVLEQGEKYKIYSFS